VELKPKLQLCCKFKTSADRLASALLGLFAAASLVKTRSRRS